MQGPNYLDLAKTLADEHLQQHADKTPFTTPHHDKSRQTARTLIGRALINVGQRLAPTDIRLRANTGPPCSQ